MPYSNERDRKVEIKGISHDSGFQYFNCGYKIYNNNKNKKKLY